MGQSPGSTAELSDGSIASTTRARHAVRVARGGHVLPCRTCVGLRRLGRPEAKITSHPTPCAVGMAAARGDSSQRCNCAYLTPSHDHAGTDRPLAALAIALSLTLF